MQKYAENLAAQGLGLLGALAMALTLFSARLKLECKAPKCSKKLGKINLNNCLS